MTANSATSNSAAASLTITAVPDPPVANPITPPAFDEDVAAVITLSYTDPDGDQATACARITGASRSRVAGSRRLQSSTSGRRVPGLSTTADAATGPASGLMPASSTPATRDRPRAHNALSKRNMVRKRWPSARLA